MPIQSSLAREALAEFVAMALFVWCGTGSAVATNKWGSVETSGGDLITIAVAFGFSISALAYAIGHISGGHMNPAVTFGLFLLKKIDVAKLVVYTIAQCLGAILGSLLLWGCTSSLTAECDVSPDLAVCRASMGSEGYGPPFWLGVNSLSVRVDIGSGFLIEMVGTYLLLFVVIFSAVHSQSAAGNAAPIAIGWAVMLAHIVLVPFTGCGINPARSLGPMVVNSIGGVPASWNWSRGCWIYYVAPYCGSALAAGTFALLYGLDNEDGDDDTPEQDPKKNDDAPEKAESVDA